MKANNLTDIQETAVAAIAHQQDTLFDEDLADYESGELNVPFAYLVWSSADSKPSPTSVTKVPLGQKKLWGIRIARVISEVGSMPDAVITMGMGTIRSIGNNEEDALALLSVGNGVSPADLPGAREYLVSHLKTGADIPTRVVGVEVLEDGSLGDRIDSGFNSAIVESKQAHT